MSRIKRLLIVMVLGGFVLGASGCVDMTAVPGVVILQGGDHQIVYLEASQALFDDGFESGASDKLVTMELTGGGTVAFYDGDFSGGVVTAYDAHPLENGVAFLVTEEAVGATVKVLLNGVASELVSIPRTAERGPVLGTQLAFSPDGRYLAISLLEFPPQFALAEFGDLTERPEMLAQLRFTGYLLDVQSGELIPLHDPTTEAVTTFAWNPAGTHLAYTTWVDSNADGQLLVSPVSGEDDATFTDLCQIRVREIASGAVTPIVSETVDVGPAFLSNDQLAYVAYNPLMSETETGATIRVYEVATGEANTVYEALTSFVGGIAVSPDYSRVAWVEFPVQFLSESEYEATLLLSDLTFTEPIEFGITELKGAIDVPVWIPEENAVLLTAGGFGGALVVSQGEEDVPLTTLLRVDLATGEQTVLSTAYLLNPAIFSTAAGIFAANPSEE